MESTRIPTLQRERRAGRPIPGNGTRAWRHLPARASCATPVVAGAFSQNGNGELRGSHNIEETGACNFPFTNTNTHSCGVSRGGTLRWMQHVLPAAIDGGWGLPVAERHLWTRADSYRRNCRGSCAA